MLFWWWDTWFLLLSLPHSSMFSLVQSYLALPLVSVPSNPPSAVQPAIGSNVSLVPPSHFVWP
jgi:hypothetical protein